MVTDRITVDPLIHHRPLTRESVLAWEARRLPRAARKIGLDAPAGHLPNQRAAFADAKLALGQADIRRRLARDLTMSTAIARATTAVVPRRRALSTCTLRVTGGDAATFAAWFADATRADYQHSMLAANPDHFLIDTAPDGRQEVIETTGGSPLATRFLIAYTDSTALTSSGDSGCRHELAGIASTVGGSAIGGVRHELSDTARGFDAHLTVEFPRLTLPSMINQHRWHLACEFSNWIEAAFRQPAR